MLLWFGDEIDAPACPENAAGLGYEGHGDPSALPLPCGACSCAPTAVTCGLPAGITVSAAPCGDGGSPAPFDGPAAWDGGCTAYDAVDSGVGSLTLAPLVVNESGCTPAQAPPGAMSGLWSTFARACTSSAGGTCPSTGETCSPAISDTFRRCVFFLAEGDVECPSASLGPYTEKHVFFASADDTRQCSSCDCAAGPGTCSAVLSVYADSACGGVPLDIPVTSATSAMPLCSDLPGSALGSKSVRLAKSTPGTCQPTGGKSIGMVIPSMPSTFCCLPP